MTRKPPLALERPATRARKGKPFALSVNGLYREAETKQSRFASRSLCGSGF